MHNTRREHPNKEYYCYYVQTSYKQLTPSDFVIGLLFVIVIFATPAFIVPKLFFESPWVILTVLVAEIAAGWLMLKLKPHRQISYHVDSEGITSEYRSTASPLITGIKFWISLIVGLFGKRDKNYLNSHSCTSRHFSWNEVVRVIPNEKLRRITLQGGLHGKLYLWTAASSYSKVLSLVKDYTMA
ncbi:MAG: hypothetical protein LUC43_03145 [Burkholderiales bacterium]|nr:hypothetical protein [Burkholderiales bacterium]